MSVKSMRGVPWKKISSHCAWFTFPSAFVRKEMAKSTYIYFGFSRGNQRDLLEETANFTVLIKNFVEFPLFGKLYRRRNIMEEANKTYLQSCIYSLRDPFCPVFRIRDMVRRRLIEICLQTFSDIQKFYIFL